MHDDLPTYTSLEQLVRLVERGGPVYVRWSRGPYADRLLSSGSRDELTGTELPGPSQPGRRGDGGPAREGP